jgi:Protein of unknown function (DUF2846)
MFSFLKISQLLCLALMPLLLTNCASTSKSSKENDTSAKTYTASDTKGIVYLYRPGRAFAGSIQTPIKVNGLDAGGTGPGTYFKWELDPGKFIFSCSTEGSSAAVELNVQPGKLYFIYQDYRFEVIHGAKVILKEVDESTGKNEVNSSKLLISTYVQ